MKRIYRDGWHTLRGYEVRVEDGRIVGATTASSAGARAGQVACGVYGPYSKSAGGHPSAIGVKASTFARSEKYFVM
ncbi:MAG: hypothetical protein LBD02_01375 [Christensenellaceae bacterium]|nr:hypothetical protein [Christensenellaceae bacterium]